MADLRDALLVELAAPGEPDLRLRGVLSRLATELGLEHCYLYVREPGGSPFRLAYAWAGADAPPESHGATGAGDAGRTAVELELFAAPTEDLAEVHTLVGPLHALRLTISGRVDAVLLVRPHRRLRGSGRARLLELRDVLASIVAALRHEEALERQLAATAAREETTRRLRTSAFTLERFLMLLLDLSVRATSAEGGFVAVADRAGRLGIRASTGLAVAVERIDVAPETGLFDWSAAGDSGALMLRPEAAIEIGIRSILAVPLLRSAAPLGIVALATFRRPAAFTEHNLGLLASFAEQVALMLENERVFEDFAERYVGLLEGIARSLDARRPQTIGYHARVARMGEAIARAAGLGAEESAAVGRAGLIHDVGLAAVPTTGPAFLADVEHPAVGAELLEGLPLNAAVAEAVAAHHEWYDGWGVPRGIRGEDIPLAGRVLGLAAFAVEMSCGDAVRAPWSPERVAEEVHRRRGTQFDPAVVDVAVPLLETELVYRSDGTHSQEDQ